MKEIEVEAKTLEDYGVFVQERDGYKFIAADEDDVAEHAGQGFVGLEYEGRYSPSMTQARAMHRALAELFPEWAPRALRVTQRGRGNGYILLNEMQELVQELLFESSPLLDRRPHYDGGGLECVFPPMTLQAYKILQPEFQKVLDMYKKYGFNSVQGGDGIHSNISYGLFGRDQDTQVENMKKWLWFLFREAQWMTEFSQRRFNYQANSDLLYMLGDPLGILPEEELRARFVSAKDEILNYLSRTEDDEGDRVGYGRRWFNLSFGRDGRPCVELRWFGSTQSEVELASMIEYSFAMPRWCRETEELEDINLKNFLGFVKTNLSEYPSLWEIASNIKIAQSTASAPVAIGQPRKVKVPVPVK